MSRTHSTRLVAILAWRYLWRNHRRTLIMLSAIAVGTWAMIIMIAFTRGMVDDMINNSVQNFLGHVQVHHPNYRDDPSIVNRIAPPSTALRRYLETNHLKWTGRIRVPAVISSERESLGVELIGVMPKNEQGMSLIPQHIQAGTFLSSSDSNGVVIGAKLARRLDTRLGKRLVIMSQDPDNHIVDRGFPIVGIYTADLKSTEERFVLIGLKTAQTLLHVDNELSELEIQGNDLRQTDAIFQQLARRLPQLDVAPWYKLDTYLGTMLSVMDGFILVWIIVVFLALSFGLINTLVMAVFERVREIGLIMALGMRPSAILQQVLLETLFLLVLGLGIGNLLAWITVIPLAEGIDISMVGEGMEMFGATSTLYPIIYAKDLLLSNGLIIVLGLIAGLLPAFRASRYDPVQALHKI
jgi:ABC-type lipoprotein release transport system permease subunit